MKIDWLKMIQVKQCYFIEDLYCYALRCEYIKDSIGIPFDFKNHMYFDYEHRSDKKEFYALAEIIKRKYKKNPDFMKELIERYKNFCRKFYESTKKYYSMDMKQKTKKELAEVFKKIVEEDKKSKIFVYLPLIVEKILVEDIKKDMINVKNTKQNMDEFLRKFSIIPFESNVSKEKKYLIKIVDKIKKDEELLNEFKSKSLTNKELVNKILKKDIVKNFESHLKKYAWLGVRNYLGMPWQVENLVPRVRLMLDKDYKKIEDERIKQDKRALQEFKRIVKELKIDKKLLRKIELLREFIVLRTVGRDKITICQFNSRPLFEEIARRMNISPIEVVYLSVVEILGFLEKNKPIPIEKIKERQKDFAIVMINNKIKEYTGKDIEKLEKKKEFVEIKYVKGIPACPGKVKGTVKIVVTVDHLSKVERGDIMIAPVTVPDYVPAMEKAKAIVTDLGGLTCHAAIVSRELGVPCIVGTKIATKVLKDGDLVEVDADKGTVKRIKK